VSDSADPRAILQHAAGFLKSGRRGDSAQANATEAPEPRPREPSPPGRDGGLRASGRLRLSTAA